MKQNPTTPVPPTETLIVESEDSDVIFVSATPAEASLTLFEVSDPHKLEKKIEEDW